MGFTKLDEGILRSSIMAEDSDTFKVWIALLASCGYDGIAKISPVFLSSVCRLPLDIIEKAIVTLESPDKHSRSLKEDGKRIRKVDGGFFVVNYSEYRGRTYSQKSDAVRQRKYRDKRDINVTKSHKSVTSCDISASASASASASVNKNHKVSLPEWVPEEEFNEYKKMRVKIKKPITDHAVELAIKELEKLKSNGYDPKDVLNQSILNSWQGLFPLREFKSGRVISGEETKEEFDQRMDKLAKKIEAEQKEEAKIL